MEKKVVVLLAVGFVLLAAMMWVLRPSQRIEVVAVITGEAAELFDVNRGEVIDAIEDEHATARLGYRYRVLIEDESDDRASGIARIGGLVTFIPGARRGQILLVELTSVRERVANGVIIRQEVAQAPPETVARARRQPERRPPPVPTPTFSPEEVTDAETATSESVQPGRLFRVLMLEASNRDPQREAVTRIGGLVVITPNTQVGDEVIIRIAERRPRVAFAEVVKHIKE